MIDKVQRKKPTEVTVKRLFALSGNLCAYPDCNQKLVDEHGTLVGQICHICAAMPGGERYVSDMTDEDRRSFDNLLLLCANHHLVTNNVARYPVSSMKEMKSKHEAKYGSAAFAPPDTAINEAIEQYTQVNIQSGSGPQFNVQGGVVIYQPPYDLEGIKQLLEVLFKENFPELRAQAREEAYEAIATFANNFAQALVSELNEGDRRNLSHPDTQFILEHALQYVARGLRPSSTNLLQKILLKRIARGEDEDRRIILDEAICVAPKLNERQLKVLALCLLLGESWETGIYSFEDFLTFATGKLHSFIIPALRHLDIRHLEYCGCATYSRPNITYGGKDFIPLLSRTYPLAFVAGLDPGEISSLHLPDEDQEEICSQLDNGREYLRFASPKALSEFQRSRPSYHHETHSKLEALFEKQLMSQQEIHALLLKTGGLSFLQAVWNDANLSRMTLTPVGISVAANYFELITGESFDEDIFYSGELAVSWESS